MKSLIFLDIDGVLNSIQHGFGVPPTTLQHIQNGSVFLDIDCLTRLYDFAKKYHSEIVISSTWRLYTPLELWPAVFRFDIPDWDIPVISHTPDLSFSDAQYDDIGAALAYKLKYRGDEVDFWLKERGLTETPHVIFDDNGDFTLRQPLVQTNVQVGLTDGDIELATKLMDLQLSARGGV